MENDDESLELFRLPAPDDGIDPVVNAVLRMDEHAHLVDNEIDIAFLFRSNEKIIGGRRILGTVYEPKVQGSLRDFFEWMTRRLLGRMPDFLVVLDAGYWADNSGRNREILIFHELAHIRQKLDRYGAPRFDMNGNPVYGLLGHDVEEFTCVVKRYGIWNDELREFIDAAGEGEER